MKGAENIIKGIPQLEFGAANGNVYWHKNLVARHDRKTQALNGAIGIEWEAMKAAMEIETDESADATAIQARRRWTSGLGTSTSRAWLR